jgi:hypothetical protein
MPLWGVAWEKTENGRAKKREGGVGHALKEGGDEKNRAFLTGLVHKMLLPDGLSRCRKGTGGKLWLSGEAVKLPGFISRQRTGF